MGLIIKKASQAILNHQTNNDFFENRLDTTAEWIKKRTGIERRYFTERGLSDFATEASLRLQLTASEKDKIKMVVVSTIGGDYIIPSIAAIVQGKLGLRGDVFALDVNMACAGFVGASILAESYLNYGEYALVIGAEKLSDVIDFSDRTTAILFGDGAGAVLYEKTEEIFYKDTGCIGDDYSLVIEKSGFIEMAGRDVFRFAVNEVPKSIKRTLSAFNENESGQIDLYLLHQANERITQGIAKQIKGDFYSNIQEYGNTSSASCAIALGELYASGELRNKRLLMAGFIYPLIFFCFVILFTI